MNDTPRPDHLWSKFAEPVFGSFTRTSMIDVVDAVFEAVEGIGVRAQPGCRLFQMRQYLIHLKEKNLGAYSDDNDRQMRATAMAFRDLIQLQAILRHCRLTEDQAFVAKTKLLLKDNFEGSVEIADNAPGRDTQFELFAFASWAAAGVGVRMGEPPEPDLILTTADGEYGAEVKRIRSAKTLRARARKASRQLKHTARGGLLITDLSYIAPAFLTAPTLAECSAVLGSLVTNYMLDHLNEVRGATSHRHCFAWCGYAQVLASAPDEGVIVPFQWQNINLCHENDSRFEYIGQYTQRLHRFAAT